ncbi:RsfA family transcriptional regulator [Cytobacillus firmus]|uniref:RsfA family transcriptional regulator n=1 Tax=Bacillaceae TaxID=186817 RepID=UPI001A8F17BE|nr:RsfA family transcriptional regulator [Bacillus sp. NTK034]MBN8203919.1 RsfA family transcriptional regulator [Bacillus sp. NTK034]
MLKTRQDSWTKEEDTLLAEIVLKHIREGGTQLQAFEEVGKQLERTSAACGFRWNANVRKLYRTEIDHAKKLRKMDSSSDVSHQNNHSRSNQNGKTLVEFDSLIDQLWALYESKNTKDNSEQDLHSIEELRDQINVLKDKNAKILEKKNKLEKEYNALKEILESAHQILKFK